MKTLPAPTISRDGLTIMSHMRRNALYEIPKNATQLVRNDIERHNARAQKRADEKAKYHAEQKAKIAEAAALVKVGDVFSASWGYDQTNVDFFQVVAKVGKTSVRIRQVCPPLVSESTCGHMAADRTYKIPGNGKLLDPIKSSVFIRDQVRGDLKRVTHTYTNSTEPCIVLRKYAVAYLEKPGLSKHYESWYA